MSACSVVEKHVELSVKGLIQRKAGSHLFVIRDPSNGIVDIEDFLGHCSVIKMAHDLNGWSWIFGEKRTSCNKSSRFCPSIEIETRLKDIVDRWLESHLLEESDYHHADEHCRSEVLHNVDKSSKLAD